MTAPQPRRVLHLPNVRMLSRGGRLTSGIRITNIRSIRPPNPEAVKQQEEDNLRVQVQKEIQSRARTCAYAGYECWTPVVSDRQYCLAHILSDPTAGYVQCNHTYGNGERCVQPAPKPQDQRDGRDQGLCFEHARAALMSRQRATAPPPPVVSTETLLTQLQHYVKVDRPRTTSCASSVSVVSDPAEPEQASPVAVDPFKQIDAKAINANYSSSILECGSASDSDGESVTLGPEGNCRHTVHSEYVEESTQEESPLCGSDSDGESVTLRPEGNCRHTVHSEYVEESTQEESPLWRAGVFTAEEAVLETNNTLRSLQSAYIRQMGRLAVLLQTARLHYLRSLKQEKEQYCSINSQAANGPLSVRERRQLRKLKAFASYRRKHGVDAVLQRKLLRKRTKANEGSSSRGLAGSLRCTFSEGGVRCSTQVLPAAKHCLKHILYDRHQVLYNPCGDNRGVASCREAVPSLPLPQACRYHVQPPAYTVFSLKKEETDTASETDTPATDCSMTEELELPIEHSLEQTLLPDTSYT